MKSGWPPPPFVKLFHKIPLFFERWLPLDVFLQSLNSKKKCCNLWANSFDTKFKHKYIQQVFLLFPHFSGFFLKIPYSRNFLDAQIPSYKIKNIDNNLLESCPLQNPNDVTSAWWYWVSFLYLNLKFILGQLCQDAFMVWTW